MVHASLAGAELLNSQVFSEGPGLEGAASRRIGWIPVRDLGEVTESRALQRGIKRSQKSMLHLLDGDRGEMVEAKQGFHERTEHPGPCGTLVVGAIPSFGSTGISAMIIKMVGGEGAQSMRSPQRAVDGIED